MASSKLSSKIVANLGYECLNFDYEVSFERFISLTSTIEIEEISPPDRKTPVFKFYLYPNENNQTKVNLILKESNSYYTCIR